MNLRHLHDARRELRFGKLTKMPLDQCAQIRFRFSFSIGLQWKFDAAEAHTICLVSNVQSNHFPAK